MPLRRAPGNPHPEKNGIRFPMQDLRHGSVVICRITEDALRMLSGSPVHSMQTMFEQYRRAAETLAGAKFDAGQSPVVLVSDVGQPETAARIRNPDSHRGGNQRLSSSTEHPSAVASQPSAVRAT